ncbi:diguanylate cyclase (GGDEF)-like protein [Loktanella sp. PT4BL]|jgi:diguanylate cyclase (GGDEF)-like protein|uniref:putative bifunctional diguanylate cyclase/phosphodiesterase n=1 Tax=Loktanella sp. PT4BL TaxID=2135611 RepID=UPI000D753718|nr:bifunctional diguanylate cyclase/phosphodiesterase [Loktanella sp. PT4BL]PXW71914.1 diguanylate cyclase (GGDEF)-like protein [Loktanella sp. PT4BL]
MRWKYNPLGVIRRPFLLRKPERLWAHYCLALMIVLCLIIFSFLQNRAMVERGLLAAQAIKRSNGQVLAAQDIIAISDGLVGANAADLAEFDNAVLNFEAVYADLRASQPNWHLFDDNLVNATQPLHQKTISFLAVAKEFAAAPPDRRFGLNLRLKYVYEQSGLHDDLLEVSSVISARFKAEATRFQIQQKAMLLASGLVLLAEALFIFRPAQISVVSSLKSMRKTTNELRTSQEKLKKMNAQLEHIVRHDPLTGLPNRRSLIEYLDGIKFDKRTDEWSLLLVGLDDFKSINDTIGHDYGDALLIAVSNALKSCVDSEHLVAHVGGDEFVLISNEASEYLIKRIFASLNEPFEISGRRIPVKASIGYLTIDGCGSQTHDLLADAEIALQFAKNTGGKKAQAFTQHLRDDLGMMQQLQLDLPDAIRNGELEPWFQPQVRLSDGRLHGAEVLVRWRHPTRGLLTPDIFLPAAERAGMMIDLDHAVWKSAMDLARGWQDEEVWRPLISLNAAPDTISDPYLIERFLRTLHRSGLDADQVVIEVLETTLINGKDDLASINIDSLAECGISLELDDFGTGYASLSKLTQLPLAGLKLDRSLITPLPDQAADSVVRAILALAAELGLHVVAEGVEENAQAIHLSERGCGIGQGYGFGRPMPPAAFTTWLSANAKSKLKAGPEIARIA